MRSTGMTSSKRYAAGWLSAVVRTARTGGPSQQRLRRGYGYRPRAGTRLLAAADPQAARLLVLDQREVAVVVPAVRAVDGGRDHHIVLPDPRRPDIEAPDGGLLALPRGEAGQRHRVLVRAAQLVVRLPVVPVAPS